MIKVKDVKPKYRIISSNNTLYTGSSKELTIHKEELSNMSRVVRMKDVRKSLEEYEYL